MQIIIPPVAEREKLHQQIQNGTAQPKLVGSNGEEILIPESIFQLLRQIVEAVATGQAVSIVSQDRELSPNEAARILNVSRPFLVDNLLKPGKIPHIKVGSHYRIRLCDVVAYKEQRDKMRSELLDELIECSQE